MNWEWAVSEWCVCLSACNTVSICHLALEPLYGFLFCDAVLEANDALSSPPLADVETWKAHIHIVSKLSMSEYLHRDPKLTWCKDKIAAQTPPWFTSLYFQSGTWHCPTMQTYDHKQTYATQDLKDRTHIKQGSYKKIHSKFTNFSQTSAIWGNKATQRYATLPHLW